MVHDSWHEKKPTRAPCKRPLFEYMEFLILLLGVFLLLVVALPFVAMAKASRAERLVDYLARKIDALENKIDLSASAPADRKQEQKQPVQPDMSPEPANDPMEDAGSREEETFAPWMQAREVEVEPLEPERVETPATTPAPPPWKSSPVVPPPPPPVSTPVTAATPSLPERQPVNWEQFMGAKLFAWIGGLALFLGIAFFIKYSFDHNLIPPAIRATIGFLVGLGLLAGGVLMKRKDTAVTAQTLSSTGILVLYGVTFACRSLYHFAFFGQGTTFLVMTVITATAFVLSVNMSAMVVAVLGIAGGFLTPVLLSTGQDAPLALFGYIALLDIGLLAVALRQRWNALPVLGAIGTLLMQAGWLMNFFYTGHYFLGNKIFIPMSIFAGFQALFLAATALCDRSEKYGRHVGASALAMGIGALLVSFFFLGFEPLGDRPVILFSYVLLVDLGLLAVIFLDDAIATAEAMAGPAVFGVLAVWSCFYLPGGHLHAIVGFYVVFSILHLATPVLRGWSHKTALPWWCSTTAVFTLPFYLLSFDVVRQHPGLLFGSVFLASLALLGFAFLNSESASRLGAAGLSTFLLLAIWTGCSMTDEHLYLALGLYFVFALLHSAAPVVLHKVRGITLPWWCNAFPALALVLVLLPIFMLPALSILIWPLVLLIDILAVILAVVTMTALPIVVVLLLSLAATGVWIFRIPAELTGLPTSLFMLGGFAVFFTLAASIASRKLAGKIEPGAPQIPTLFGGMGNPANLTVQIPALSAVLPFLLLIMLTLRLPLANPSPVFGLALLLSVLLLGLAKIMSLETLPAVGLGSAAALEYAWRFNHYVFHPSHAGMILGWYLIFYFVFMVFPFLFHRQFAKTTAPWAAAALAGPLHFYLVYDLVRIAWPSMGGAMGLLPAAFSIPAILGVAVLLKRTPADSAARNGQLAWLGGMALFFITLIFPIQFDREWITLGWALEGAALCWLFRRVPHRGLSITGACLLAVAFCRLALNPAVLSYHDRAGIPVWNWYLYAYGIAAVCLFAGARLLAPPRNMVLGSNVPPALYGMGTVLAFLLVNIEIADFFTAPGAQSLTFEFSGNFGRDMSYSIAWALFALLMLVIGISKKLAPVRYAGIGLLAVTLLKLFLHDLSQLDQLYRIAAFIVVAVIAIFASFLYQRFLGAAVKTNPDSINP